jgi:ubiquinone/menaquinone biosynthesis C-methylase UbiE
VTQPVAANPNAGIYDRNYAAQQLDLPTTPWDRDLVALRLGLIRTHGTGRDVLDLCCGTGSYLLPELARFRSAYAVDFSTAMLDGLRARLPVVPETLHILQEDAECLTLPDRCVDFAWSFTSLYYVPRLDRALTEVGRVLRPGGLAALELGNARSLNALVGRVQHEREGWAKHYLRPLGELRALVEAAGLEVVEWRSFQLLTMYGTPRPLLPLAPLLSARWKPVLSRRVAGRMLDEWISSAPGLRSLAFRHLVLARRPEERQSPDR